MTRWGIGINNFWFTGSVILEEAPWYIFIIESCISWICHFIPPIPLPKIKIKIDGEVTNLYDYYGTTADLFHVFVCDPIQQWCFRKIKNDWIHFPYFLLEQKFPEKFKDDHTFTEEEVADNKIRSKIICDEFELAYKDLKLLSQVVYNERIKS